VKDFYIRWPRWVSIAGQKRDNDFCLDLAQRIEALPATEGACEKLFCQLHTFVSDFLHKVSDSMTVDLSIINTRIIWPDAAQIKECTVILMEVQFGTDPDQAATWCLLVPQHLENVPCFSGHPSPLKQS
jgi:hypothetical protein